MNRILIYLVFGIVAVFVGQELLIRFSARLGAFVLEKEIGEYLEYLNS